MVGYKQPPEATRFRKGQSGNPKGRPRKPRPQEKETGSRTASKEKDRYDSVLDAELTRPQLFEEKGKRKRIPMRELVVRRTLLTALKGSPTAQGVVLREARALEDREAERQWLAQAEEETFQAALESIRVRQEDAWDHWLTGGERPSQLFPHPHDIDSWRTGSQSLVRWPFSEDDLPYAVLLRLQRDRDLILALQQDTTTKLGRDFSAVHFLSCTLHNERLSVLWRIDLSQYGRQLTRAYDMTPKQAQRELDLIDEMGQLLRARQKFRDTDLDKGMTRKLDRASQQYGFRDIAALNAHFEDERQKRMTRGMRHEAYERLEAMFIITVEDERRRRRQVAEAFERLPLHAKGKAVTVG